MLTIVGRVTVEGSGVAVGDVVVEAFDVTRDTTHTGPLTASDISWVGSEPSLGSAITASDGTFTLTASGLTSYPVRTAVAVFGATGAAAELIQLVTRTRLLNDGTHHYAVEVPADGATRTGPVGGAAALAAAAEQRVTAAKNLRKAASALRSADVDTARKRIAADDPKVIEGLVDLAIAPTKNSRGEPSPNIVPLGKKVAEHIRDLLRGALDSAANTATVRALVDVSDDVRPSLFDADGQPIDVAGELNIRTALFGPAFADGIPSRHRRDPLDVACRLRRSPYLDCGDTAKPGHDAGGGPDDGPGPGDGAGPDDGTGNGDEAGLERIRAMTLDLLDDTTELATATAALAEPATAQTIGQDLAELRLSGGPAEDIAMFDFERLYLAAELAVLPDVDDGLVYEVSDSIRVVAELGGNVADPSHDKEDVLTAVSSETRAVREAAPQRPPQQPTMVPRTGEPLGYRKYLVEEQREMWGGSQSTSSDGSAAGDIEDRFYDLVGYLNDLSWLRRTSYPFLPFAVDDGGPGITYGLVLGYRQRWEPTGYQVGELVKSVPLAPKSTTRYSTKRKRVRSYSEKRLQASESTYSSEEVDVSRDVSKIANASKHGTSFTLSNDVGVTVPGVGIGGNSKATWERSASKESQSTKEAFREETHKQAELHKQSQSLEVTFSTVDELDTEVTSEISNPNDEIVVTYLFYELQRRFMVSEHLHAVTPVVLVAQPIPAPGALDATWLARYDWILRRVLLDKSFAAALGWAVSGKVVADKGRVEQLEANLDRQAALVEALKKDLVDFRDLSWVVPDSDSVAEFLQVVIYDREHPGWRDDEAKVREVFGDEVADRLALRKKTTASKEEELKKEVGRLESAIAAFIAGFTNYATEAIQVERLLLHIKDNILYYMQAIWEHEGRDQRYLRLRHVSVPNVVGPIQYEFGVSEGPPRAPTFRVPVSVTAAALLRVDGDVELGDIADLAVPLGFVGNAMVFPLMRWDPLVEFMMVPYACAFTGVSDPDAGAGMTLSEIRELVCCLKRELQPDEWQALTAAIDASWNARVVDPRPDAEELMVPTGSLIIEALPGRHALLESFKLAHRVLDVQQVASDLVTKRLEQLRMAARILSGDLEDPSIDKKVTVEGTDSVLVSPGPDN